MTELIHKTSAYEKYDGTRHIFETYRQKITGAAPYVIILDGAFLATAESGADVSSEIKSTINWFNWTSTNPAFV